jgi:hypothetical protein
LADRLLPQHKPLWRAAQADTRCNAWFASRLARREVLPSMATMSGSRSRSPSTQAVKQSANSLEGSAFITSFSVSCEAMPRANGKSRRRKASFRRAQRAISTKSSAPASVPHRITVRISGKGYTTFHD